MARINSPRALRFAPGFSLDLAMCRAYRRRSAALPSPKARLPTPRESPPLAQVNDAAEQDAGPPAHDEPATGALVEVLQ